MANSAAATANVGAKTFTAMAGEDIEFNIGAQSATLASGDYILIASEKWKDLEDKGNDSGVEWIISFNSIKPCPCLLYKLSSPTVPARLLRAPYYEFDGTTDSAQIYIY